MPQEIVCGGCGEVFYRGTDLQPPEEIIRQLKGQCPKCGKELAFDSNNVEIGGPREGIRRKR